jgi:hypothetical protein
MKKVLPVAGWVVTVTEALNRIRTADVTQGT